MFVKQMEAAFICCQQLPDKDKDLNQLEDGMEYMVVDLGGIVTLSILSLFIVIIEKIKI